MSMSGPTEKTPLVLLSREGRMATVTLNRPEKANAASQEVFKAASAVLQEVAADGSVGAVIVTGAGKSFCAGTDVHNDLVRFQHMSDSEWKVMVDHAVTTYLTVYNMPKPVIAAINGYAVGVGLDLALACDIRVAAEDAKLGAFEVRMGLTPEIALSLMPRLVGLGKARLLAFTGDVVDAREAERIGLVDMVVPANSLMLEAQKLASRLADGPVALGAIKKAINDSLEMSVESSLRAAMQLQQRLSRTEDHKEAVAAFLEKRAPVFKGR
jgi:enoyl-CoA hydratase